MSKRNPKLGFGTLSQHAGYDPKDHREHMTEPIYQGVAVEFPSAEIAAQRFRGEAPGLVYARLSNDTSNILEERVAALEGGEAALAFNSGMLAILTLILKTVPLGCNVIAQRRLYGGTGVLLGQFLPKIGRNAIFVDDFNNEQEWREAIRIAKPNASLILLEMPANPTLDLIDLEMVVKIARENHIPVAVDSTFATPVLFRPLEWGADFVIHSATKYFAPGACMAGILIGPQNFIHDLRYNEYMVMGGALQATEAAKCLQGIRTLELRVKAQSGNALDIVFRLSDTFAKYVKRIYYPWRTEDIKQIFLARRYFHHGWGGGVLAFEYKGTREQCVRFVQRLKIFTHAVNLGDTKSIVTHPASTTHSRLTAEELAAAGISETLVRLSVGLENLEDLIADLKQAFSRS